MKEESKTKLVKYIPTCHCGEAPGKKTILSQEVHVGITTKFHANGTFKENTGLYLENRYCPQCGAPRKILIQESD